MEPTTKADEDELQKAINSITNAGGAGVGQGAVEDGATGGVGVGATEVGVSAVVDTMTAVSEAPVVGAVVEPVVGVGVMPSSGASYGEPSSGLGAVKVKALTDLRPLVEKVELLPEAKFKVYKEIIVATDDKAAIEPAYLAAVGIGAEKDRAEALLFVIEAIDKSGVG